MKLDDMVNLPDEVRCKIRPFRKRHAYHGDKRPRRTREELIEYLRSHNFRSQCQLEAGRKSGDPQPYDYIREFGKWQNAKAEIFGLGYEFDLGVDANTLIRMVVESNLWTAAKYRAKRRQMPDIFPSFHKIIRKWGSFALLKQWARRYSLKATLEAYRTLWRRLGKPPTITEARLNGIVLEDAIPFYETKELMDNLLAGLEADDAGKT